MTDLLDGLVVPLVTPMRTPGVPNATAGAPLLAWLAAAGATKLMLLGSNGEGPLIPAGRTGDFIAGVVARWRDLVPGGVILANVTAPGTDELLLRAAAAASAGADALVASPPTYFRHGDDEIVAHYAALDRFGLPVVAYNAPRYAAPITPALAAAPAGLPHVVGMKDSSGDIQPLLGNGLPVSQGDERAMASGLRAGAVGITPGIANLAPRLCLGLLADHSLQDRATALTRLHQVRPGVPAVKALLAARGLCPPHCAPPLAPCTPSEVAVLLGVAGPYLDPPPGG